MSAGPKPKTRVWTKTAVNSMKKMISIITALVLTFIIALPVSAAGNVIYEKDAGNFIFEYGSEHSETDLFSDFKGVMPGDNITQTVTVRNDASYKVKVKIYMRSHGAHEDSEDFLSKFSLKVKRSDDNEMAYMFDAAANETAGLTDWVLLGTLYSGGKVNLDVTLSLPTDVGNDYAGKIGKLDWEFKVEELPIDIDDPRPPQTGDSRTLTVWMILLVSSAILTVLMFVIIRRNDKKAKA